MAEVKVLEASIVDEESISTYVDGEVDIVATALQGLCVHILKNFEDIGQGAQFLQTVMAGSLAQSEDIRNGVDEDLKEVE